jgi:hypothetical protein
MGNTETKIHGTEHTPSSEYMPNNNEQLMNGGSTDYIPPSHLDNDDNGVKHGNAENDGNDDYMLQTRKATDPNFDSFYNGSGRVTFNESKNTTIPNTQTSPRLQMKEDVYEGVGNSETMGHEIDTMNRDVLQEEHAEMFMNKGLSNNMKM